jgi:hypothetical protein
MHDAGLELNRRPLQSAKLRHPQAMPEGDQDHRRVALTPPVAFSCLHQALDLKLGQVLAVAPAACVNAKACQSPSGYLWLL